jgi:hypothetical protein
MFIGPLRNRVDCYAGGKRGAKAAFDQVRCVTPSTARGLSASKAAILLPVCSNSGNVRYWHKADISIALTNVRFWG